MFLGKGHKTSPTTNFSGQFLESVSKATFLESGFLAVFSERIISMQLLFRKKKKSSQNIHLGGHAIISSKTPWITSSTFQLRCQGKTLRDGELTSLQRNHLRHANWKVQARIHPFDLVLQRAVGFKMFWRPTPSWWRRSSLFSGLMSFGVLWMLFNMSFLNINPQKKLDTFTKGFNRTWLLPKHCFQVDHEG